MSGFQDRVERSFVGTVDVDLGKHREVDVVEVAGPLGDLLVRAGLLPTELIAGETKNGQPVDFVIERTQTCVLRGSPSLTRDVDGENIPAFE